MHSIVHAAILLVGNVFINSDTSPKMLTEVEHLRLYRVLEKKRDNTFLQLKIDSSSPQSSNALHANVCTTSMDPIIQCGMLCTPHGLLIHDTTTVSICRGR